MNTAVANAPHTQPAPVHYPVNIRITIPFLPRAFFVTLIVGPERRGSARLREERKRHPITTLGNLATIVTTLIILNISALFAAFVIAAL